MNANTIFAANNPGKLLYAGHKLVELFPGLNNNSIVGTCVGYYAVLGTKNYNLIVDAHFATEDIKKVFTPRNNKDIPKNAVWVIESDPCGPFYIFDEFVDWLLLRPTKILNPYPNHCKICKAPSRKLDNLILCSNAKCKSRSNIKRAYYIKKVSGAEDLRVDINGYILCPECNTTANSSSLNGEWAKCRNKHNWTPKLIIGDRLDHDTHKYIWSGTSWQELNIRVSNQ